jgi:hypothetical protein
MVAGKNLFFTIIYPSHLIICASLKEIHLIVNDELMPQDLISEITKGHNSGKNGRRKKSFLYNHLHILLDHLCKFERNLPDSLGVDATRFGDVRTYVRTSATLYASHFVGA